MQGPPKGDGRANRAMVCSRWGGKGVAGNSKPIDGRIIWKTQTQNCHIKMFFVLDCASCAFHWKSPGRWTQAKLRFSWRFQGIAAVNWGIDRHANGTVCTVPGGLGRRIVVELMQKKSELFHGFWLGLPLHLKEGAYQHSHLADQTRAEGVVLYILVVSATKNHGNQKHGSKSTKDFKGLQNYIFLVAKLFALGSS